MRAGQGHLHGGRDVLQHEGRLQVRQHHVPGQLRQASQKVSLLYYKIAHAQTFQNVTRLLTPQFGD